MEDKTIVVTRIKSCPW